MSAPQDFTIGTRVLVTHNPERDHQYARTTQWARRANAGKPGVIKSRGTGHDLCFCVDHDGGGIAWWEPDELRPEPTAREKELLDILGIALVGLRTAVSRGADDQVLCNVEAGLTAMGLDPDDMHAAALRLDNGDPV